ncbi:hypothetical protein [Micromonospora inaquosa]|uniref:hypothetical protein n=1 Tax=Micromonospora inaquosa TaxID=2203716 RepID=UPI0013153985|nr:hypothetical protein [Micromonospora inaquosa]
MIEDEAITTPVAQRPFVLSTPVAPVERHGKADPHLPTHTGPAPAAATAQG